MLSYEQQLERHPDLALLERELYFQEQSAVHVTARRFASDLGKRGIEYAVAGDLCMFMHGFRRFADTLEVLVTSDGLKRIHQELVGHGYIRPSEAEKSIRDATNGVCIKFLISGEYPGHESL